MSVLLSLHGFWCVNVQVFVRPKTKPEAICAGIIFKVTTDVFIWTAKTQSMDFL